MQKIEGLEKAKIPLILSNDVLRDDSKV